MITKQIADNLVKKHETFYRKWLKLGDTDVFIYNYLLVDHDSFKEEYSRELRGLTITVENGIERVFLSIPKFFNVNETPETQYDILQNKIIKKVQNKVDGSMIQFIEVEGNILAKTKQSFDNTQSKQAQEIVDTSSTLKFFILDCWANGFYPLFELIGPSNRHVIEYKHDALVLLAVRDIEGHFIDVNKFNYQFTVESKDINIFTLDELMKLKETEKDTEGYVVKFNDGVIVKIKTNDFVTKHRIYDSTNSDKILLQKILDSELDDILGVLYNNETKRKDVLNKERVVVDYINHWSIFCNDVANDVTNGDFTRKDVALKYKKHRHFDTIMRSFGKEVSETKDILVHNTKNKYNKEMKARDFFEFLTQK